MNHRKVTVLGAAALMVGVLATSASAHATFQGTKTAPANSDQQLTLNVPEEEGPTVHNAAVAARLPEGWTALACAPIAGWQCALESSPVVVRWTRDTGAPDVAQETFTLTVHTGPAGDVPVPVVQTYAGGEVIDWTGPAGSESPAPVFRVTAAASPSPSAAASPSPSPAASPSPSPSPAVSPEQAPTASPSPAAVAGAQQGQGGQGGQGSLGQTLPRTGTDATIPAAIVAVLVALGSGALLLGRRRRKSAA